MAVYTKYNRNKIEEILSKYSLGKLDSFKGIEEGIENTNYFLSVNKKKFILTVYEKRVKPVDLPFFSDLIEQVSDYSYGVHFVFWLLSCKINLFEFRDSFAENQFFSIFNTT